MNPDAGLSLFSEALYLGMLNSGYVWIATDWLSSALDSTILDYDTMNSLQGVISYVGIFQFYSRSMILLLDGTIYAKLGLLMVD